MDYVPMSNSKLKDSRQMSFISAEGGRYRDSSKGQQYHSQDQIIQIDHPYDGGRSTEFFRINP